uniref:Uncharacterized protein n=1 Tax=Rhizophora mucronata TaxID=61149 RepID=A0A2P2PRT6_RHIMU
MPFGKNTCFISNNHFNFEIWSKRQMNYFLNYSLRKLRSRGHLDGCILVFHVFSH